MRKQIKIVIGAWLGLSMGVFVSAGSAQSLQRPVNVPPTAEISLGDLASQVTPTRQPGSPHVYTNADLKLRPAPMLPTTPPFPEIAPERGILEHPGMPEITPPQFEYAPAGGIPLWDVAPGTFFGPFPGQRRNRRGRLLQPGEGLHDRFAIFTPGFGLRSSALGPPLDARRDLFTVKPQGSSRGRSGKKD